MVCNILCAQVWFGSLQWWRVAGAYHVKGAAFDISVTSWCFFCKYLIGILFLVFQTQVVVVLGIFLKIVFQFIVQVLFLIAGKCILIAGILYVWQIISQLKSLHAVQNNYLCWDGWMIITSLFSFSLSFWIKISL